MTRVGTLTLATVLRSAKRLHRLRVSAVPSGSARREAVRRPARCESSASTPAAEHHGYCRGVPSILLVSNRSAGSADRKDVELAAAILCRGAEVETVVLKSGNDLGRCLDRRDGRWVVVAGGDGTLHRVVAALHARGQLSETVLGLVPLGTGNDFARGVGVPLEVDAAADLVLTGRHRDLDLIVDDHGDIAVNNVNLGIGAEASRRGALWKERLGRVGYGIGALQAAFHRAYRLEVQIDGDRVVDPRRAVLEVSVGNGTSVAGGLDMHPEAYPGGGRLDVVVSFTTGPLGRIAYGFDLLRATHHQRGDVLHHQATTVSVSGGPFYLSADGEISGPESRRSWHIQPAAFRMPLPPDIAGES